jgi:hypothetical protein
MNLLIASMIRHSGRSFWQARYSDGHVLSEWDTAPIKIHLPTNIASKLSRWEDVPKDGMIGLRLLCPNGMAGELEAPEGHRFLQLKTGGMDIGPGGGRYCDAHIIGVLLDHNGNCLCRAWEVKERKLIEFFDNIFAMQYRHIGMLSTEVQGLKI